MYIYRSIMRDIIWTIIVVWLIFKVVSLFRSVGHKTRPASAQQAPHESQHSSKHPKDLESAIRNSMNKEGEYVEFEEIK